MNVIFFFMVLAAVCTAGWRQIVWTPEAGGVPPMEMLSRAMVDSATGSVVSTLQGSTETSFYVLAVYFGAAQIKRIRHALAAALTADVAGILAAMAVCSFLYGG